jgi:V/A-type H+-transporting ATPase subunit F
VAFVWKIRFLNLGVILALDDPLANSTTEGIKGDLSRVLLIELRVVAVGSRVFVTSFQLAGVEGIKANSAEDVLNEIGRISNSDDVGLILVSDDFGKQIRYQLTELRSKKPIPLVFELPSPGSTKETVDYRALLKQILGV